MLKIEPGYKNFVQLFTKLQTDSKAVMVASDKTFMHTMSSLSGGIAHFFQARAVNRNNTNTHNYEITNHYPKLSGQSTD